MRRAALIALPLLLALGCSDDGGGGGDALGDDPTLGQCQDAVRLFYDRFEVPDDVDISDGTDDGERQAIEAAGQGAAEGIFDLDDPDHPCNELLDGMSSEEIDAFMDDLDPEVIAVLGAAAQAEFTEVGGSIER